uniref:ZT_dimer domain-containing protein n=1 Tax=Syphacia muris TaxID=451379 RepID=A0A0N5AEV5_9BILA
MVFFREFCSPIKNQRRGYAIQRYHKYLHYLEEQHIADKKLLEQQEGLGDRGDSDRRQIHDKWLAWSSLAVNIIMMIAKIVASYLSHSLSIISALVDSVMDILNGAAVYLCIRVIQKTNPYEYPVGRKRLEPVSILIVSVIMVMTNLMVILETVMSVLNKTSFCSRIIVVFQVDPHVTVVVASVMCTGTLAKFVLLLFCWKYDSPNSRLLALDQRNDIMTNIVALGAAYIGEKWWLYADPLGGSLVCLYIVMSYIKSAQTQIPLLIGKGAKPEFISRLAKIAIDHDPRIKSVETLTVYHLGANYLVELHVILSANMLLQEAHDISESLQLKLEKLPYVERAFVHCDYSNEKLEHLTRFR